MTYATFLLGNTIQQFKDMLFMQLHPRIPHFSVRRKNLWVSVCSVILFRLKLVFICNQLGWVCCQQSFTLGLWDYGDSCFLCALGIFFSQSCVIKTKLILIISFFLKKEYTGRKCTKISIAALWKERAVAFFLLFGIFHIFFN